MRASDSYVVLLGGGCILGRVYIGKNLSKLEQQYSNSVVVFTVPTELKFQQFVSISCIAHLVNKQKDKDSLKY